MRSELGLVHRPAPAGLREEEAIVDVRAIRSLEVGIRASESYLVFPYHIPEVVKPVSLPNTGSTPLSSPPPDGV